MMPTARMNATAATRMPATTASWYDTRVRLKPDTTYKSYGVSGFSRTKQTTKQIAKNARYAPTLMTPAPPSTNPARTISANETTPMRRISSFSPLSTSSTSSTGSLGDGNTLRTILRAEAATSAHRSPKTTYAVSD